MSIERKLWDFFALLKSIGLVSVRDLDSEEIEMAEELVSRGKITKLSTKISTFYICYEEKTP